MSLQDYDLPHVFKYHCFVCCQQRPPGHPRGSCGAAGAQPLWEHLINKVQAMQRTDISITTSGCMGFCSAGPLMVVYPEGFWYQPKTIQDIDAIAQSHLVEGRPAEELVVVLKQ